MTADVAASIKGLTNQENRSTNIATQGCRPTFRGRRILEIDVGTCAYVPTLSTVYAMDSPLLTKVRLDAAGVGAYFRPRDVVPLGVSFRELQQLAAGGTVEKFGGGIYRLSEVEPNELETLAMVAVASPNAVLCLLTALSVYGIGTQSPHEVWIALDRKGRTPRRVPTRLRIFRFSGAMLTYGVVKRTMLGVPVSLTSPARTVVDCFRYRNKVGIDVAIEALRDAVRSRITTVNEIVRAAEVCRARTVIRTYLDALEP